MRSARSSSSAAVVGSMGPMLSRPGSPEPPPAGRRTWRPWQEAWADAAYGPAGFWSTQQPRHHFTTGVGTGPLVARAVAGLVPPGAEVVVDVGAGDGALLTALVERLPGVALVGVDRRARPPGLHPAVRWVVDHHDVDAGRWVGPGPVGWCARATVPLLVAHEWLDDLPVPVVQRRDEDWHEVEVDRAGNERSGAEVGAEDRAWLDRWWPSGDRAEVGRVRDVAWTALVRAATTLGGRALLVDYGHRGDRRPRRGSFTAYGRGRQRGPLPDGSVNLTAAVAVDALAAGGEEAGATTLLLARQAEVLAPPTSGSSGDGQVDALTTFVRRSERAALTSPERWGDLWWLLQGAPTS